MLAITRSSTFARCFNHPPAPNARAATPMAAVKELQAIVAAGALNSNPIPSGARVNANGTTNAGIVYFQVIIIVRNGFAPVIAAAAKGESAVGGLTSDNTA